MVQMIMNDETFLRISSSPATETDMPVAQDLIDTLEANKVHCVGMATNMIGVSKRIIAVNDNGKYLLMFNPEIIKCGPLRPRRAGPVKSSSMKLTIAMASLFKQASPDVAFVSTSGDVSLWHSPYIS